MKYTYTAITIDIIGTYYNICICMVYNNNIFFSLLIKFLQSVN